MANGKMHSGLSYLKEFFDFVEKFLNFVETCLLVEIFPIDQNYMFFV